MISAQRENRRRKTKRAGIAQDEAERWHTQTPGTALAPREGTRPDGDTETTQVPGLKFTLKSLQRESGA